MQNNISVENTIVKLREEGLELFDIFFKNVAKQQGDA